MNGHFKKSEKENEDKENEKSTQHFRRRILRHSNKWADIFQFDSQWVRWTFPHVHTHNAYPPIKRHWVEASYLTLFLSLSFSPCVCLHWKTKPINSPVASLSLSPAPLALRRANIKWIIIFYHTCTQYMMSDNFLAVWMFIQVDWVRL